MVGLLVLQAVVRVLFHPPACFLSVLASGQASPCRSPDPPVLTATDFTGKRACLLHPLSIPLSPLLEAWPLLCQSLCPEKETLAWVTPTAEAGTVKGAELGIDRVGESCMCGGEACPRGRLC